MVYCVLSKQEGAKYWNFRYMLIILNVVLLSFMFYLNMSPSLPYF